MGQRKHPKSGPSRKEARRSRNKPHHLLTLPGEIRNQIYRLVLQDQHDQSATFSLSSELSDAEIFRPSPQQPPLARTGRQLRHEVLSVFYGERTFDVERETGIQCLVATWTRLMRPALFYLRSIRFELFSEHTTTSKDREDGLNDIVAVHAWLTDHGTIDFELDSDTTCACKFARCARDVERGVLGSPDEAPLARFLKAWDLPAPPVRGDRYMVCNGCGGGNLQVSLRDIRRRASLSC